MNIIRNYKIFKYLKKDFKDFDMFNFIEFKISNLIKEEYHNFYEIDTYINNENEFIFKYYHKNNIIRIKYSNFWQVLEQEYLLEYLEIQEILTYLIHQKYNLKINMSYYYVEP